VAQNPTPGQISNYGGAVQTGTGVIYDALGNPVVVGANMPVGAGSGKVVASDASGNLTLQSSGSILPLTTLGDMLYEDATPTPARLAGNTAATKNFLTQTGTGVISAAPAWGTIAAGDLPTGTTSTKGALRLDGTASDILPTGIQLAGATGFAADAGHSHSLVDFQQEPSGTLARTIPLHSINNAVAALTTGGVVAVNIIALPAGLVVSNIMVAVGGTAANGPTHFWTALLDSTLHVLAVSADLGNAAEPANTAIKQAVTTDGTHPYTVAATGYYYVAVSGSASTTAPTLAGVSGISAIANLTPTPYGTAGTQAAPPSVAAQLNSGTITPANNQNFAAWLS